MNRRYLPLLGLCFAMTSCADRIEAINQDRIRATLTAVKTEVGDYQRSVYDFARGLRSDPDQSLVDAAKNGCPGGPLLVQVTKVHVELTATTDQSVSGSGSVTAPIAIAPSVSVSAGREWTNGQTLEFDEAVAQPITTQVLSSNQGVPDPDVFGRVQDVHGELYNALMRFRQAALAAAGIKPCFVAPKQDPNSKSAGNTIALAFTIVDTGGGSVGIKLSTVAGFSLSASNKTTSGNTMTITFLIQTPTGVFFQ